VNCKHACFDIQNNHAMRKNNNKYLCEFSSLVLEGSSKKSYCDSITSKSEKKKKKKTIVIPKSKFKAKPHYNTFEMGILPTQLTFVVKG
jgi:hypothetical protein